MKKDTPPLICMDEETKQLLQERAKARSLSESGYVRMLICQDAGLTLNMEHSSRRAKKTIIDLYRYIFKTDRYDVVDMKNYNEKNLLDAVNSLPARQRRFILEYYREDLTLDQIGKRNGLTKEPVRQAIQRARLRLRDWKGIQSPKRNTVLQR